MKTSGDRDISAQEVCHLLISWPLVHSSRIFVLLNLYEDKYENIQIEGPKLNTSKPVMINQYRNRSCTVQNENLENVSLLEFCQNFDCKGENILSTKNLEL